MSGRDEATQRQIEASDPVASTWLSANAGSGKTRVLTDRVARLLLDGVDPQNILCLTYTKAAASEMQNRLFKRLGLWAMMDGSQLAADLEALGTVGLITEERLRDARRLFARAIETPGGLKIQTIHSFCAGLLRRFPLEAGVSPQFMEMDDRTAELLREEVVDGIASGSDMAQLDRIAQLFTGESLQSLLAEIGRRRDAFLTPLDLPRLTESFGLSPGATRRDALRIAVQGHETGLVKALQDAFVGQSKTYVDFAARLATLDLDQPDWLALQTLFDLFLYKSGEMQGQSKSVNFPLSTHTKAVVAMEALADVVHDWMDRVALAQQHVFAVDARDRTVALYDFATVFVPAYEMLKLHRGLLDFDDLIRKARHLLTDAAVAQWVLFRLDGGIDHILVDEAQDTSPDQWAVIACLAQEFSAGEGANPQRQRSIFVVGDKKQSIYSFQGADPDAFDRMRHHFSTELAQSGAALNPLSLDFSFRSSQAILEVVDQTFQGQDAATGPDVYHRAFKEKMPGRVDLWPVVEPIKEDDDSRVWTDPVDQVSEAHHAVRLAKTIASEIRMLVETGTIPAELGQTGEYVQRRVTEGDILILVPRRSGEIFEAIISACKAAGLRVAGADRLKVAAELAVRDILTVLRFLALPEDDLSLAAALKSPLFGWDEQMLYTLAQGRSGYLWQALRASPQAPETNAMLDDLRREADFLRPYDLIERILTRHGGRINLLARLGGEAEDGIDALLSQALTYEQSEVPSLTGFLAWIDSDELEIKRQMDSASDQIRVMTVHGAKGLESPIVILPDTAKRPVQIREELFPADDLVIWRTAATAAPPTVTALRQAMIAAQERERMRLLYVAMTRAESWLIVCAAGDVGDEGQSWYRYIEDGMQRAGAVPRDFGQGQGLRHEVRDWTVLDLLPVATAPVDTVLRPEFGPVTRASQSRSLIWSPSQLGGDKSIYDDDSDPGLTDPDDALTRGDLVHLLLEHLPMATPEDRVALGHALTLGLENAAGLDAPDAIIEDVCRMIERPELAHVFAPSSLAEVSLTAALPELDGARLHGTIDRLIIDDDAILAVDFKTNRVAPKQASDVPEGLLRQMGAYRAMLHAVFPGRAISTAILWTSTAELMHLPDHLVAEAFARATLVAPS